jgi:hypothetical protein
VSTTRDCIIQSRSADKPWNEERLLRGGIELADHFRRAVAGFLGGGVTGFGKLPKSPSGVQDLDVVIRVEVVAAVAGVIHDNLGVHAVLEAMTKAMQQPKTSQLVRIFSERALENVPLEGAGAS